MNEKYYYVEEFCKPYRQLMPVAYKKMSDEQYHKIDMSCTQRETGKCKIPLEECLHFQKAPEIIPADRLRDIKIR